MTLRHVWVILTVAATFIGPASAPVGLQDLFWTLRRGAWIIEHGRLLDADAFTSAPHIPGAALNVQWLADLFFYGLEAAGGLALVVTGTAVLVAIAYGLLLAAAVTASGHLRLSCGAVLIAYVLGVSNLSPRPQTLAYPLFALFLLAIVRGEHRKDTRLLWLLPPAMVVWTNVHGSFVTGFVLLGAVVVGRAVASRSVWSARPYSVTLAACLLASLVNPYGPGALQYVTTIGSSPIIRDLVTEWAPTSVGLREGVLFFASLVGLSILMLRAQKRLTPVELAVVIVFAFLGWSSVRFIVWWGLVLAPIFARLLGEVVPNRATSGRNLPVVNALIVAGVAMVVYASLPWNKERLPLLPPDKRGLLGPDAPTGVAAYLQEHGPPPSGKMFNHQVWGGYLEWTIWPRHVVFVDGRFELHPDQVWFDYLDVVFPTANWRDLLARHEISYAVLSKIDEGDLIADLLVEPGWRLDYEDQLGVIFTRAGG